MEFLVVHPSESHLPLLRFAFLPVRAGKGWIARLSEDFVVLFSELTKEVVLEFRR